MSNLARALTAISLNLPRRATACGSPKKVSGAYAVSVCGRLHIPGLPFSGGVCHHRAVIGRKAVVTAPIW